MHPDQKIVTREDYDDLLEQLKWTHAILGILVELEGGAVQITQEVLEGYNLANEIRVVFNPETLTYTIEQVLAGEVVENA